MFLASICPSSGVQVVCCCIWYSAIGVVAVVLRSRCLFLCTVCKFASSHIQTYTQRTRLHTGSLGPQPQHLVLNTICSTYNLYSWRWAYRCQKHVEIFMIINHNCCIKLVPLVIFIYDARSHIHQRKVSFTVMWIIKLEGCTLFWSTKFPDVFLEIMYRILIVFYFMADKHLRNSRPTIPHNFSHAKPQAINHFSLQMPRVNPRPVHRGSVVDKVALGQVFLQVL